LAKAEPHDPEPIMQTLCLPDDNGDGGREGIGDEGRVKAGVVTVEAISISDIRDASGEEDDDALVDMLCVCRRDRVSVYVCRCVL
jgi:hypothetical protein